MAKRLRSMRVTRPSYSETIGVGVRRALEDLGDHRVICVIPATIEWQGDVEAPGIGVRYAVVEVDVLVEVDD